MFDAIATWRTRHPGVGTRGHVVDTPIAQLTSILPVDLGMLIVSSQQARWWESGRDWVGRLGAVLGVPVTVVPA